MEEWVARPQQTAIDHFFLRPSNKNLTPICSKYKSFEDDNNYRHILSARILPHLIICTLRTWKGRRLCLLTAELTKLWFSLHVPQPTANNLPHSRIHNLMFIAYVFNNYNWHKCCSQFHIMSKKEIQQRIHDAQGLQVHWKPGFHTLNILLTGVTRFQLKEYLSNNCSVGTEHWALIHGTVNCIFDRHRSMTNCHC